MKHVVPVVSSCLLGVSGLAQALGWCVGGRHPVSGHISHIPEYFQNTRLASEVTFASALAAHSDIKARSTSIEGKEGPGTGDTQAGQIANRQLQGDTSREVTFAFCLYSFKRFIYIFVFYPLKYVSCVDRVCL